MDKLKRKKLDLVVANDVSLSGIGFGSDDNQVTFVREDSSSEKLAKMSKREVAEILLDRILVIADTKGRTFPNPSKQILP